jgi:hypothetical protein
MKEQLKEYLLNNIDTLKYIVRDINSYDGTLDWLDYYENDEYFFQDFYGDKVDEAVRAVCYGDYNYTDDYVRINAYGNLDTCNEFSLKDELESSIDDIVDRLIDLKDINYIYDMCNYEIKKILDEEENK